MAAHQWRDAVLCRGWRSGSTRQNPNHTPAPDLVDRDFTASAPNRLWVANATRIPCEEGIFWLRAVRDVVLHRIVGWKTSDRCGTDLILGALEYGISSRDVRDGQLTITTTRVRELHVVPFRDSVGRQRNSAVHGVHGRQLWL